MSLMCHKPLLSQTIKQQQGSALVVALFIIIVMGLLVGSMSRLLVSSSESISYEVLGTRAFFAAQSGMERSLSLLYVLDAPVLTSCPATPDIDFGVVGIAGLEQLRRTLSRTEKTLIPLASKRADLELAAYQAGNSQLTSVITAQRDLIEAQLRQIEQQRKLSQLSASLYYAYVEGLK